jgi:hypothetical protein
LTASHGAYEASLTTASTNKQGTVAKADQVYSAAIAAVGSDVGWRPGWPTGEATAIAGFASAAAARANSRAAAEQQRQSDLFKAQETLRAAAAADSVIY